MAAEGDVNTNRANTPKARCAGFFGALCTLATMLLLLGRPVHAQQRVQIPAQNPSAFGGAPGFAPSQPVFGPPPVFDSYAGPGGVTPFGQAPIVTSPGFAPTAPLGQPAPLTQAAPFGQPGAFAPPPSLAPGSLFPNGLPFAWEPGSYSYQPDGATGVRFTKLLQKLDGEYTHLFGDDSPADLQLNRVEVSSTLALPVGQSLDNPVLLTPGFAANFFEVGGATTGVDDFDVFAAFLDWAWFPRVNDAFSAELGFRTGVWTDFDKVNSESIRLLGRGVGVVRLSPTLEVLAGVVYLDRERIKLLPVAGVRWRPSDNVHFDAVFPNPVVRRRLSTSGTTDWWAFVSGEYGGGSWVDRFNPQGFDYNDLRVSLGVEFETQRRVTGKFEVGFVFDRELFFPGVGGGAETVLEFDETLMLRAGVNL